MKEYHRNLRKDILGVVSKRLLPKNQNLQFVRTQCQACVKEVKHGHECTVDTRPTKVQSAVMKVYEKRKEKLGLFSNLYEMTIKSDKLAEIDSPRKLIKVISNKESPKNPQISPQSMISAIKQWVTYTMNAIRNPSQQNIAVLPLENESQLQNLKQLIQQQAHPHSDIKVFHSRDSLMSQSQTLNSSLFKKSMKVPHLPLQQQQENSNFSPPKGLHSYKQLEPYENQQNHSHKLLHSTSTISSEKNIVKMGEKSYDELMRLLLIQAISIENMM